VTIYGFAEEDEIALPTDRRFGENLRYARHEQSMLAIDRTPLYKLTIEGLGSLSKTLRGKDFMAYCSPQDPNNEGQLTPIAPFSQHPSARFQTGAFCGLSSARMLNSSCYALELL
jgi:hypothetical protein